jgi:hypothetical protein
VTWVGVICVPQEPFGVCTHTPPLQTSLVQALLSEVQTVPSGAFPSAGQEPDEPVQLSATSQSPEAARQIVVAGWNPSLQWPDPSQESVPSQAPPFEVPVQAVVAGANPSAGQEPDEPVQLSATSHWPADSRQIVVEDL